MKKIKRKSDNNSSRNVVINFRVTPEQKGQIKSLAKRCGKSISRYMCEVGVGQHPRCRLTDKECDALSSLTDARADLVNIRSALSKKTDEQKLKFFNNPKFMKAWIDAVNRIIQHWENIETNILQ